MPAWLVLSFLLLHLPNAASAKYNKDAQGHSTSGFVPDASAAANFHCPELIRNHCNLPGFTGRSFASSEREGFVVWGGCLVLWTALIIRLVVGYSWQQLSTEPDRRRRLRAGRTSGVASGSKQELLAAPDLAKPEASPTSAPEIDGLTQVGRGRQFASSTPWTVKEPCFASGQRQVWMSPMVIGGLERKHDFTGQELNSSGFPSEFPTLCYPVQASLSPRTKLHPRNQVLSDGSPGLRWIPYPHLTNPNLRSNKRGSTTNPVEASLSKRSSLEVSLYGSPRLFRPGFVWFILVVAVNGRFSDPEHDLEFWRKMLDDPALTSEAIRFKYLAGENATRKSLEESITQIFHDSEALGVSDRAKLFVYLTGEGDAQNRMCLPNAEFLSKKDINRWLWKLRATWRYSRPITLMFDICRDDKHEEGIELHHGVEIVSSCSVGQKAQAIEFTSNQDTPYSCFFFAFLIASSDSLARTTTSFKTDIGRCLNQLVGLMKSNPLKNISEGGIESHSSQEPDWSQASDLSTLLELARMLSRTKMAREVREFFTKYISEEACAIQLSGDGPGCEIT